ncbi:MAG: histidine triad nucleotide-binding protein [Luminiphilus sp.]|jgi:histidine triad (HIT) family protein
MEDTIFGKITRGEIPTEFLYEDDHCVAIRDINPQAPTHVLIIPRKPIPRLVDSEAEDQALLGHLLLVAGRVADKLGVGEAFRLVINNGEGGGQTVFHLHLHILAGREMTEGQLSAGLN